jgi:hypothetical protein
MLLFPMVLRCISTGPIAGRGLHACGSFSAGCIYTIAAGAHADGCRGFGTQNRKKRLKIVGIILIVAGAAAILYGGFSYTTRKKAVDLGPIQLDRVQHHSVTLPPLLGLVAIVGGAGLVYFGAQNRR